MPLLSTKLIIPPLRPRLVERPRLIHELNRGIHCGFVLVSAPAGYGKTTLLSAWLRQVNLPVTWLSLDDGDNDLHRFLTYLTAALGKIDPSIEGNIELVPQISSMPPVEILLIPLINHLSLHNHRLCLVLDDYHAIQNQAVHQAVNFLLEHRPEQLHLVILTRADPPFPLSRMRARSQVMELRLNDLRFSSLEIAEFLREVMGLHLSEADLASLEISTEGWAAGLQMAGLSLLGRKETASFINSFSGDNRYILDFLFEEVFQRQTTELQDFLLQTAILDRFCVSLCSAVTLREDSQAFLSALERNNLFLIALDEQREWYRYHHLFLDLLRTRLKKINTANILLLHQRASAWYAGENDLENAIVHSLEAQDFEQAAKLIEQVVQDLDMLNQQVMLTSWVDRLPREILEAHPWLCVYRAWGYFWIGRREAEEEWLQMAENAIERGDVKESPEIQHIQGHIAAVRAHAALVAENIPRALEMGQRAMVLLPDGDDMRSETAIALGGVYWALGDVLQSEQAFRAAQTAALQVHNTRAVPSTCYVGMQKIKQGRLNEAQAIFQEALRMGTLPDGSETLIASVPNVRLGDVCRERNELALASQFLLRGLDQAIRLNQVDVLAEAYVCLARYQFSVSHYGQTHQTLDLVEHILRKTKVDPWILCWLDECRLKAWLSEGKLESVNQWAVKSGLSPDGPFSYHYDLHHQNLARALVAQARFNTFPVVVSDRSFPLRTFAAVG